jgi:hypothetical protein
MRRRCTAASRSCSAPTTALRGFGSRTRSSPFVGAPAAELATCCSVRLRGATPPLAAVAACSASTLSADWKRAEAAHLVARTSTPAARSSSKSSCASDTASPPARTAAARSTTPSSSSSWPNRARGTGVLASAT